MQAESAKDIVVLGFDFGLRRIGVAVGQSVTKTASPLKTIIANNGVPDWEEVAALITEWQPDQLVVGIPTKMDGTEQEITKEAREFAEKLAKRFQLPVEYVDERLTTKAARAEVFASRGFKGLRETEIDSIAATIIVEDWLATVS